MPVIVKYQGTGKMAGVLEVNQESQILELGDYRLRISFRSGRRPQSPDAKGYGLIIATGPDEYLAAGSGFSISFTPNTPGPLIARIAFVDEGRFVDGKWIPGRRMNGDENGGGTRLQLPGAALSVQRIKLYRHR